MKLQVKSSLGLYVTKNNGDVVLYKEGQIVPDSVVKMLNSIQLAKCEPVAKEGRVDYTWEEKEYIIQLYLELFQLPGTVDYEGIFAEFHQVFPDRAFNSVKKLAYAIQCRDALCPQTGLTSLAQDVADELYAIDPERFPLQPKTSSKVDRLLDKLLADIRG